MESGRPSIKRFTGITWVLGIALASATLGMVVAWRAPGLDLYGRDWLMRVRGPLPPPNDIAIVAIDEPSITRYGRFPWPRSIIARAIGFVAAARPKAIAVDVLFTDPTTNMDDKALSDAVLSAGDVVSAAQLVMSDSGEAVWLRPLPPIERASAGLGHVNVSTELEGVARQLLVQEADDEGHALWAMAVETVRVADGASSGSAGEVAGAIRVGSHLVPVRSDMSSVSLGSAGPRMARRLKPQRMTIDYVGPAGSFRPYTFSISDVVEGRVRPGQFSGKYVLIGATGASLGDRVASPFMHVDASGESQHGALMPGVEVLANSLNTILRSRFYSETPDWVAFLCAFMVALVATGALSMGHVRYETLKQVSILIVLGLVLLAAAYIVFIRWLFLPPLVPAMVSLAAAAPLALVRRSMIASAGLDERVRELARAESWLWPSSISPANPAALIAKLSGAVAVAIFSRDNSSNGGFSLAGSYGAPVLGNGRGRAIARLFAEPSDPTAEPPAVSPSLYFVYPYGGADVHQVARTFRLGPAQAPSGILVLAHDMNDPPNTEAIRLCAGLAASFVAQLAAGGNDILDLETKPRSQFWRHLPRGVEWKTRALGILNRRLLARARFVDRAIRSVEDGLMIGGLDSRIVFVNRRVTEILGVPEGSLLGSHLLERLGEMPESAKETLATLFNLRAVVEREITLGDGLQRRYNLRLSPVLDDGGQDRTVIGLVASLSDITRQHELQQMKTDVMALVTHELRTPLTAIQGISEVLTQFEVDPKRQREMHSAIYDEAKRLSRMIDEYLDITKLESGVRPLRLAPVRLESVVERALLLLDPLAARRGVNILRQFSPSLPAVLIDADLLARAVTNLVANAIKYSPANSEVTVWVRSEGDTLLVEVSDHGCGISHENLGRIFDKFYRVPRVEDAETPGTGLGLTMVREIMDLHGGAVNVKSTLGAGSTFSLRLPLAPKTKQGGGLSNDG